MKKILLSLLIVLIFLINTDSTYATGNTEQNNAEHVATFCIQSNYSSNITPLEGDVFEIIIGIHGESGWDNTATITLDASKIYNESVAIELPIGSYDIKRITYVGTNKGRNSYGIESFFNVANGNTETISLTIGYETTKAGDKKWQNFIGVGLISDDYFMQQVVENPNITFEELESEKIALETAENNSNNLEQIIDSTNEQCIVEIHGVLYDGNADNIENNTSNDVIETTENNSETTTEISTEDIILNNTENQTTENVTTHTNTDTITEKNDSDTTSDNTGIIFIVCISAVILIVTIIIILKKKGKKL